MFQPLGTVAEHVEHPSGATGDEGAPKTQIAAGDMMALKSLCMNCGESGTTNLLLITIPFFRNVIIMAFECPECGCRNSEVQAAEIQEKGCKFELTVETKRVRGTGGEGKGTTPTDVVNAFLAPVQDLNRQIVKSDRASVRIPELDFEIPAGTQRGVFTVSF